MYVTVFKSGKYEYVRISESYRDETGKTRHRVVKNLGRLDVQLAENPRFLDELKERYALDGENKKQARLKAAHEIHLQDALELLDSSEDQQSDKPFPLLRYGHMALRKIWNDDLDLERHLTYLQKAKSCIDYKLNDAVFYLTAMKVLDPHSVLHSYMDRIDFLGDPAKGISLDACYDSYSRLYEYKKEILRHINKSIDKIYGEKRAKLIYYDVTNVYFETPMTDAEKGLQTTDYLERLAEFIERCRNRKDNPLGNECFDPKTNKVIQSKLPDWFYEELSKEKIEFLRMRGPSKEHRFDMPITSIALVIDSNGMPMDFEVYSGDSSEYKTMPRSIESLKDIYNIKDAVVVADRGLNSASNLLMLLQKGLGFLVAQKVSQFDEKTMNLMLDIDSYTYIDKDNKDLGCFRTIENWIKCPNSKNSVECTLVLTWNKARKERDEALIDIAVEMVKRKKAAGCKVAPRKTGWGKFAKTEEKAEQPILGVDEDEVAKQKRLCGFAAMVYRQPDNIKDNEAPDGAKIAGTYHKLNQIENCFRIMKSNLGLRPVYVKRSDHIEGHIMVCFMALVLLRLLQDKLISIGVKMSYDGICSSLNDALVLAMSGKKNNIYLAHAQLHGSECGRGMTVREHIKRQRQGLLDSSTPAISKILKACGLSPLPRIGRLAEVASCLGTKWPTIADAIPSEQLSNL